MTQRSEETKKFFADIDKRIGQSEKRARDRSYELRKGMAISEEHKKAIERGKLESDARRKQLKKQSKQNRIDAVTISRFRAAESLLNRVGLGKQETTNVNVQAVHGIVLLPPKKGMTGS